MALVEGGGESTHPAVEVGLLAVGMWALLWEGAIVEKGKPCPMGTWRTAAEVKALP